MSSDSNFTQQKYYLGSNPRALWVYCFGYNLNLVLQDGIKKNPNSEMENTLVKKLSVLNFIKGSPKRYEIFREMVEQDFY